MKKYLIILSIAFISSSLSVQADSYTFSQDLSVGSRGADVVQLQTWLITNGYNIPSISSGVAGKGYFGAQTKVALMAYQHSIGLPAFGFFGHLTRGHLNGNTIIVSPSNAPIISGIDAPTSLTVGQMGTWTVRASDPSNGTLSYSVDWGDVALMTSCDPVIGYTGNPCPQTSAGITASAFVQNAVFTHSYNSAGTYTVRFFVRNSNGLTAQTSSSVLVNNTTSVGPLKIISPNGGEVWQKGTKQTIMWTSPQYFRATYADIKLFPSAPSCPQYGACPQYAMEPYTIITGISINQNSYVWNVGIVLPTGSPAPTIPIVPEGQYTIQICETGTSNCDSSDTSFMISSAVAAQPSISLTLPYNIYGGFSRGSQMNISWNAQNIPDNSAVALTLTDSKGATVGVITQDAQTTGSYTWTIPTCTSGASSSSGNQYVSYYQCHPTDSNGVYETPPGIYQITARLYSPKGGYGGSMIAPSSQLQILATSPASSFTIQ